MVLTVFGIHDGLYRRTQHLDVVLLEYTTLIKFHTAVQSRLTAEGQQNAVRTFFGNHLLNEVRLNRQEVDFIGYAFRRLHRSDVGIDKHRTDALLA